MNRGVARRTIFDTRCDYRYFLACLARAVRRAEIELLAYAQMQTHFHLLVRSLGGLSDAMRRVQLRYVRRFNRLRRRDGPLMRGRFLSCRVRGPRHTRKARLADGSRSVLPEVGPKALVRAIQVEYPGMTSAQTPVPGAGTYSTSELLISGMLRDVACCAHERIAQILQMDVRRVARLARFHRRCVDLLPSYAQIAAAIVARCIEELNDGEEPLPGTNRSQF